MIEHKSFKKLRLHRFASDVVELQGWEFMGREWIGEAIGFSEWLRPSDDPDSLGSLAIDLRDLPLEISSAMLSALGLQLRSGMTLEEVRNVLGEPVLVETFVESRKSYEFVVGAVERYSVSCTILNDGGLCYLVVMLV